MNFRGAKFVLITLVAVLAASVALPNVADAQEGLLARVKARGNLICGVNGGLAGFGLVAPDGTVTGFDADFCRAIAAAIFGDPTKVEFKPISAADRFPAIQAEQIDVLIRNTTNTFERDTRQGADFGPTIFYDGQTFLVRRADNLSTVKDLDGATICVIKGTTTEANLSDIIATSGIKATVTPYDDVNLVFEAFIAGSCQAVTSDRSQLASRQATSPQGAEWVLFDENFSKEPLAPVYKAGDAQWGDLVRWVTYATIIAEEYGLTSENVEMMAADAKLPPEAKRLLGVEGELHTFLGLEKDWAINVIKAVGNYGEIYERNLGALGVARGPNKLWTQGGLLYAPPYR
ncbi:MAG: amino acid ABC transporter substrate-binding protein [Candidatus Thermofonsia Clade 1 bacterium]|jgi:general L-amino acid transport system substrate-binding protein|uniref:Amino acid ABC transporter substrate-binding protein n=1 Tax=Candidatus Thermofonsia Clade 1 bacterium TaxID=2364210 RepID=A0A2M8PIQ3_9CHLR|nr:MAG: amino acid ABC transporter substrate-binding protein [Candidatus Thermofonsia Clade 1 bacterium]PJF43174.1 MAG: amino acid ABC transporter substrate-binding protein [Candidatus Thermofonsia Clade 1 bacterium]RMF52330.1 MAG: amino acid ABC transporter substrate-binding protein [Chloroflexota bacterium]